MIDALTKGGSFIAESIISGGGKSLGAEASRPAAAASTTNDAKVTVDFNNLPKGARVAQDSSGTQPINLNMGYSMVTF